MPSTERLIEWSKNFADHLSEQNYQLYLEVAQAACRHSRDSRGLSTVPELANADHYWLARYFVFLSAGAGGDVSDSVTPELNERGAEFQRYMGGFIAGSVTAYALVPIITVVWDVWKRVDRRTPPMGDPLPSAPSVDQIMWAFRGCNIGFVKDAEHADQMIWGFAINRFLDGALTIPAPPL